MQSSKRRRPFPVHILVFLAPAVLLYTVFMVYPLINSLRLSFFEIGQQNQQSFVGLQNYIKLFTNENFAPFFWGALRNNFIFFAMFSDCTHRVEPGCAVRAAVETGDLDHARYKSFLKLGREQEHLDARTDWFKQQEKKARGKSIAKAIKDLEKRKDR